MACPTLDQRTVDRHRAFVGETERVGRSILSEELTEPSAANRRISQSGLQSFATVREYTEDHSEFRLSAAQTSGIRSK